MKEQTQTYELGPAGKYQILGFPVRSLIRFCSSPSDLAWDTILANEGPAETLSMFRKPFSDSEHLDNRGFTVLHRVILHLDGRDLKTYLYRCSRKDLDRGDVRGLTSLHWAARRGDSKNVNLLLQGGADPNISTNLGVCPLHYASRRGDLQTVNYLIRYGANINAVNSLLFTPFLYMFSFPMPNLVCAQRLIHGGALIDVQDYQGATALGFAAQHNNIPGVNFLLRNGAETNIPTLIKETALTIAIQTDAHGAIPVLLTHGASLRQHTVSGRSLLHEAAEHSDEETLRLLTSARIQSVQIQHKSKDGHTAWDLARKRTDVTPEWRAAFADLIASVDERTSRTSFERWQAVTKDVSGSTCAAFGHDQSGREQALERSRETSRMASPASEATAPRRLRFVSCLRGDRVVCGHERVNLDGSSGGMGIAAR